MKRKSRKTDEQQNPLHREYGLFSNMKYILQKMFSFALNGDADDERIDEVLRQSGLYEDAHDLEKGLDTCLFKTFDENGTELSGGQKQKTAISRAGSRCGI